MGERRVGSGRVGSGVRHLRDMAPLNGLRCTGMDPCKFRQGAGYQTWGLQGSTEGGRILTAYGNHLRGCCVVNGRPMHLVYPCIESMAMLKQEATGFEVAMNVHSRIFAPKAVLLSRHEISKRASRTLQFRECD